MKRLVNLRQKAILDENQLKYEANVLGREEVKVEVVKRALENNIDIEIITIITGLSKSEVIDIKGKIN